MGSEVDINLKIGRIKKFIVHKVGEQDGEGNYFVLAPERDRAAFEALKTYRDHCNESELTQDINCWLKIISRKMGWKDA